MCSRIIPTTLFSVYFLLKGSIYVLWWDCFTIILLWLWYLSNRDYWELFSICRSCKNKNRRKFEARKKFYLTEFGKISISWLNVSLWYPLHLSPFQYQNTNPLSKIYLLGVCIFLFTLKYQSIFLCWNNVYIYYKVQIFTLQHIVYNNKLRNNSLSRF